MILPLLLSLVAPVAEAPPAYSGRDSQVRVTVPRLEDQMKVDGVLDEAAWERAARLVGFSQYAPVDGRPAENATEVLVWYSPSAIHFGIRPNAEAGTAGAALTPGTPLTPPPSSPFTVRTRRPAPPGPDPAAVPDSPTPATPNR